MQTTEAEDLVQPTKGELKNGWTPEKLTAYMKERDKANAGVVLFGTYTMHGETHQYREPPKPNSQNNKYSPLRWR